jgi:ADP-ribose pyrophosphatase YjhB (NUDIX family)
MADRCHGYTHPVPLRCKNKATHAGKFCSKHTSISTDVITRTPEKLPPQPAKALPANPSGNYTIKTVLYERAQVEFTNGEFNGKTKWVYNFPMAANTVDLVVFDPTLTKVLLVQRSETTEPVIYRLKWAVPGGFMDPTENATQAAIREFNEEVSADIHIDDKTLYHVYTATVPTRDVRQRTISIVFTTILPLKDVKGQPVDLDEIKRWKWFSVEEIFQKSDLSFDHVNLIARALATQQIMKQLDSATRKLLQIASTDMATADPTYRRSGK